MSTFNFTSYFGTFNFDILLLLIQLTLLIFESIFQCGIKICSYQ